jgi:glycosyltransferase involved in cell wall biosynthesis
MGGAARFASELYSYLARTGRDDVKIIGAMRRVDPAWLVQREFVTMTRSRRIALNNVSFVAPGGERWTLLRNALHFLSSDEAARLDPLLRAKCAREARVVRLAASRADALIVPSTAMADRVTRLMPTVHSRIIVRPHPVSADAIPRRPRDMSILCPVLFASYKQMSQRIAELLNAVDKVGDPSVRVLITADRCEVPPVFATNPRIELVGKLEQAELRDLWARSRAIFFPTGLESFGYPLAEARVSGQPVIARDTAQNREIAGDALRAFTLGEDDSLTRAVASAMTTEVTPDPDTFNPVSYFDWLLGEKR